MDLLECYKVLDIAPDAAPADAKRAHRLLIKQWHPDQFLSDTDLQKTAHEKTKEINSAHTLISIFMEANPNAEKRRILLTQPTQLIAKRKAGGQRMSYAFAALLVVIAGGVLMLLGMDVFGAKPPISVANEETSAAAMKYLQPDKDQKKQAAPPAPLSFFKSSKSDKAPAAPLKF